MTKSALQHLKLWVRYKLQVFSIHRLLKSEPPCGECWYWMWVQKVVSWQKKKNVVTARVKCFPSLSNRDAESPSVSTSWVSLIKNFPREIRWLHGMTELAPHLKDLLSGHLDAAVACLRLLLGQLLPEDLELLNKVPLVLGHREALGLFWELSGGHQSLLGLILWLVLTTRGGRERETRCVSTRSNSKQTGLRMRGKVSKNLDQYKEKEAKNLRTQLSETERSFCVLCEEQTLWGHLGSTSSQTAAQPLTDTHTHSQR